MFKVWFLIMLFFVGCLTGLLSWIADFSRYYDYSAHGKTTEATLLIRTATPTRSLFVDGETKYQIDLKFKTDDGVDVTVSPYLPASVIEKLKTDGSAEIVYLVDDPRSVIYKGQELPKNFGSLLLGLLSGIVGVLLLTIRHKLVPYAKYLGRDA